MQGATTCLSTFSNGSSSYMYAGNLRLGGFDTGNTIWNGNANLGITVNSGYTINIGMNGGNGSIIAVTNTGINLKQPITLKTNNWILSDDGILREYYQNNGTTYFHSHNANGEGFIFRNAAQGDIVTIKDNGNTYFTGNLIGGAIISYGTVDFGQSYSTGASFRSRMISYFENNVYVSGYFSCKMTSVANSGTDYIGVQINTSQGSDYTAALYIMYGSFTGFHRCFSNDTEFKDNPQQFKDNYMGRIVISIGKIATDERKVDDNIWTIKYDKEGITIEDALPIVELSRIKKAKRVFGVYGLLNRSNSRQERLIVNSVGEGGIWVCNSNGNIENGDYIQSSDYLGYGEKQDDDILHNYTVAKATINCSFELDSIYYNCIEIDNGVRVAFISCTYHCG